MYRKFLISFLSAGILLNTVHAHTWNEQLALIDRDTGKYTGSYGYPRAYVERTDPGFNDAMMTWLIPELSTGRTRVNNQDLLCHPGQRTTTQTSGFPRLQAAPGSVIAMKYLENGHVTLPQNQPGKPPSSGTVFVFGTSSPSETETLVDVMQWTSDGTGGDKRGRLLTAQNFDDGRCHQVNTGAISEQRQKEFPDPPPPSTAGPSEQWCETDLMLPESSDVISPGSLYTLYWIWQWPTAAGAPGLPGGKDEYYSSCSDLEIVPNEQDGPIANTLVQQDPQTQAVTDYLSRTAITSVPDISFYMQSDWPVITSWGDFLPPMASGVGSGTNDISSTAPATPASSTATPALTSQIVTPTDVDAGVIVPGVSAIGSGIPLVASSTPLTTPPYPSVTSSSPSNGQSPVTTITIPSPSPVLSASSILNTGSTDSFLTQSPSSTYAATDLATFTIQITALPGQVFSMVKDSTTFTYTIPMTSATPSSSLEQRDISTPHVAQIEPPIDNSPAVFTGSLPPGPTASDSTRISVYRRMSTSVRRKLFAGSKDEIERHGKSSY